MVVATMSMPRLVTVEAPRERQGRASYRGRCPFRPAAVDERSHAPWESPAIVWQAVVSIVRRNQWQV